MVRGSPHNLDKRKGVFPGIPSLRVENPVVRSSQAMLETVTRTLSASKEAWTEGSSVLDQLDSIEVRIKQHMQGNLVNEEATIATESEPSGKVQPPSPLAPTQPSSHSPLMTPPPTRPPVLRTLSELLPQVTCDSYSYCILPSLPNLPMILSHVLFTSALLRSCKTPPCFQTD